jgi:hypothetical protein
MSLLSRITRTRIAVLALAIGAAALTAAASPAQAAIAAVAAPAVDSSACSSGGNPQVFELEDRASGTIASINLSTRGISFDSANGPFVFCQAPLGNGIIQLFDDLSTNYCVAYSAVNNNAYEHVPTGCTASAASLASYMRWKFIGTGNDSGRPYYKLQTGWNGTCMHTELNSPAVSFVSCSSSSASLYYADGV